MSICKACGAELVWIKTAAVKAAINLPDKKDTDSTKSIK